MDYKALVFVLCFAGCSDTEWCDVVVDVYQAGEVVDTVEKRMRRLWIDRDYRQRGGWSNHGPLAFKIKSYKCDGEPNG